MAFAWFLVGGFKGQVTFPGQVLFFGIVGVSAALGLGSLLFLPRDSRSAQAWIPVVGLMVVSTCSGVLAPVFASAKFAATRSQCLNNVKRTGQSVIMYTTDWNDNLPPCENWQARTSRYLDAQSHSLKCKEAEVPYTYAMNGALSRFSLNALEDSTKTVIIFEAASKTPSPFGGKEKLANWHGSASICLADGRATSTTKSANTYRWKP